MQIRRYTFKLYPTAAQVARFERNLDLHRALYNAALEERIDCYRKTGKTLTRFDQSRSVPEIRKVYPEIGELQANAIIETLVRLDNAYQAFFRRAKAGAGASSGFPRFKGTHFFSSWCYPADYAFSFEQTGPSKFRIRGGGPKKDDTLGWVKARGAFPVEGWAPRTATIMRRDGGWWLSLAVQIPARREAGTATTTVHMDLIDRFAAVEMVGPTHGLRDAQTAGEADRGCSRCTNADGCEPLASPDAADVGHVPPPADQGGCGASLKSFGGRENSMSGPALADAIDAERRLDELKSECDRNFKRGSWRWRERRRIIARASARAARARKEALHVWTTRVARASASLTVISPAVSTETKSAKGTVKRPGAAVQTVASVNRAALSQAPAAAVQMLAYKAVEAGIEFREIADKTPAISIGRDISEAKKAERKARRAVRKAA